jgi:class 3 adenylate cyclase
LFSDLVGSTDLLAELGEAAFDEFRRDHFQALREAVAEHAGREIKTTGDGILAVFASAAGALCAAVRMQQAIDRPAAPERPAVAIRVGLAHGDVVFEDHDVFGMPVVLQAARLAAAARGGQILTTAVVPLVAGARAKTPCTELGSMSLKGVPGPVAVCQVAWEPTEYTAEPTAGVEFRLLGPVEVLVGGREIGTGSTKQRALLAMLVLQPNTVVPADALIKALSGEHRPPSTWLPHRPPRRAARSGLPTLGGRRPRNERHPPCRGSTRPSGTLLGAAESLRDSLAEIPAPSSPRTSIRAGSGRPRQSDPCATTSTSGTAGM